MHRPGSGHLFASVSAAATGGLIVVVLLPSGRPVLLGVAGILIVAVVACLAWLDAANTRLWRDLHRRATRDELTGLLNRAGFLTRLNEQLHVGPVHLIYLDLDGFRNINDARGQGAGNQVLQHTAGHLLAALPPGADAARLGGDEFALAYDATVRGPGTDPMDLATALATAIGSDPRCLGAGVSLGTVTGTGAPPGGGPGDGEALLRDADLAMYTAKRSGGLRCAQHQPWMNAEIIERSSVEAGLKQALRAQRGSTELTQVLEFDLQPVVCLDGQQWIGFESLVRWQDHSIRRAPTDFLPIAAQVGLISEIGLWVLRSSLEWLARWPHEQMGVCVNVVGSQIADARFTDLVITELAAAGLDPWRLTLEVTEQTPVDHLIRARDSLRPLRQLGVHVALDDFGTGFSSLEYLAQLPVDVLKIDQSFIAGLGQSRASDAVVETVLALGRDLGLEVIAEGVETLNQHQILLDVGCPTAQGFLYSKPIQADQLTPDLAQLDPRDPPCQNC